MASQYLARLGIVLGVDSGELVTGIEAAKKQFKGFSNQVEKDTKAAVREFDALKTATEDYGRTLTKVEQIQREIERGRFMFASQNVKEKLLEQAKAYDAQAAAMKKTNTVLTDQQKLQVSYQLTDFFTQIASGQNAMIAFIQQGGQLKDTMGGVGGAFRAIASLITPMTIAIGAAAATVGTLGYAFYSGWKEAKEFNTALALTNRYAGISYKEFGMLSEELSNNTGRSIGLVKDSLQALVASGQYTRDTLLALTKVVSNYASVAGVTGKEAADKLMSGLNGTASGARQLNSQMNFLTLEQYKYIESLEKAGKKQEAAKEAAMALNKMLDTQRREVGALESAWKGLKTTASDFWDWLKSIGRPEESSEAVTRLKDEILGLEFALKKSLGTSNSDKNARAAIQKEIDFKKNELETILETQRLLNRSRSNVAGEKEKVETYAEAGGLNARIQLAREAAKLESEARFKALMNAASEEKQIKIQMDKEIADAVREAREKNEDTKGQFAAEVARIREAKISQARLEASKKSAELYKKQAQEDFQARVAAFEKESEILVQLAQQREKMFADAKNRAEAQQFQREELAMRMGMIGASKTELEIMKSRIDAQRELERLMRTQEFRNMKKEDQDQLVQMYEQTQKAKEANIELAESLAKVQNMYDAVWSNMSSAIENFVRTGKLSIKDFVKSVIQDFLIMQMKLQAMTLIRGLLGSFMAGLNTGSVGNATTMKPGGGYFADGGDPPVNKVSVVGERGPELFIPRTAGTIIPNHALGMGSTTNVTNNYINAIDAKSFEQRLLESNQAIWTANQYATKNLSTNFGRT